MTEHPANRALMARETISAPVLEFLRSTDSPTLANAIELLRLRPVTDGFLGGQIRSQFPELPPMVGRALTVTMTNARNADPGRERYWTMWETLEAAKGPIVLVIADESGQPDRVAYAGEIMSTLAKRLGAVGMVTDGGFRDIREVRELGFHYFMKFPVVSHADFEVVSVGEPVTLDGQRVETGDILHGDENGIVLIPDEALATLEERVAAVREREARQLAFIRSEDFSLDQLRPGHSH